MNGDRVTIVGSVQIGDADRLWTADVKGGAMGMRVTCAHLADQLDLGLRDRAHGYHDWSVEAAGGAAEKVGDEHRDQGPELDIAHTDPGLDQRMLEGQAAPEQKADQIIAPEVADLAALLDQLAPAVDPVAGQIGAQVGPWRRAGWFRIAGRCDLDQRTGLGVARAESGELGSRLLWQDHQIGLLVGRALPSGAATPFAATGGGTHF